MSPRANDKNQIIRDERREMILDHAMRVFARRGYAAAKISDVAQSACMSQGLVYHYFASKADMFIAVIEQTLELSNNAMKSILSVPMEPYEKMKLLTERNLNYGDPEDYALRWLMMLQAGLTDSVPEGARTLLGEKFGSVEYVKEIIEEGQKRGQFITSKDPGALATAYWSLIEGIIFFRALGAADWGQHVSLPDAETVMKILL